MSAYAEAMRRHAGELVDEQLHRLRHRLDALEPERRLAVEESVRAVVDRVADAIIAQAQRSAMVAATLESIYGQTPPCQLTPDGTEGRRRRRRRDPALMAQKTASVQQRCITRTPRGDDSGRYGWGSA